ncbi:Oligoxyloglucan reducing end-specific cellobiohydrolase [Clavulina sp. PMI_390]|nr:Oligoxyloglucan reducing end-specific cellobiohydrolase [Clavulina sp. PMI_390]
MLALLATNTVFDTARAAPPTADFKSLPDRIFYFEDTTVVFYHDPVDHNLYISEDEGAKWGLVSDIPHGDAHMFIEHPYNNRIAYVMSRGKKHWRTTNRGKLWQSFELPSKIATTGAPLSFHADKSKEGHVLYQGTKCHGFLPWEKDCDDETYYTTDGFESHALLLEKTSTCTFAHATPQLTPSVSSNLILCVAFEGSSKGMHSLADSRLFSSEDFFKDDKKVVDFGSSHPKAGRGVAALGVVNKFLVAAMSDLVNAPANGPSEMLLYVSLDGYTWSHARFPHGSSSKLFENAYTIVESTTHSLAVDVLTHTKSTIGTLFVSNSNGTYFTESLKDTNRNEFGFVDFEDVQGVEGVGIANTVSNAQDVDGMGHWKKLKSVITFDDGRSWAPIAAPSKKLDGSSWSCTPSTESGSSCSLHLYSVTSPHNIGRVFSTTAPGILMGVGNVGATLKSYDEGDTFISLDAGVTWKMIREGAAKYEVGDTGGVIVLVDDEEATDFVEYSTDFGSTWKKYDIGTKIRARLLTTVPDSTSRKFILLGTRPRGTGGDPHAVVFLDFANDETGGSKLRECEDNDMEKWYARPQNGKECLMGHKQWYNRRKPDAACYVGHKFQEPVEHEDTCVCEKEDYECDYNYIRQNGECVAVGPEPIPAGKCPGNSDGEHYMGSSGYRLIPGNTCKKDGGVVMDDPIRKDCSQAQPPEGNATHQPFEFPQQVVAHWWFRESKTLIAQLQDGEVWQSGNEGYSWAIPKAVEKEKVLAVYFHSYSNDRAYLFTKTQVYITTDTGRSYHAADLPTEPNMLGLQLLHTHPLDSDWLIFIGAVDCTKTTGNCRAVAYYSLNHGRDWTKIEEYVRSCSWARDKDLKIDSQLIMCESYRDKKGSQLFFGGNNPLELWLGGNFYKNRKKLFNNIVGHAKFSEYLLVGEVTKDSLDLQVSLDGRTYHKGVFPPSMNLNNHAYTILESSTDSVFLHLTTSSKQGAEVGNLLKSNWNGTYYGLSLENVNRNQGGYVDFEKMIGLDGIALVNVVANPSEAGVSLKKKVQTRITHNDGGTWKAMTPPAVDSTGQKYQCNSVKCALHIHGYTERIDARATYSSPSAVGLMMAVGNVGEYLAPYTESDTFFTRDGGFTWEEIRKDAHMFEFGDSGSILVLANDEKYTDRVLYSTNEGMDWKEYVYGMDLRVRSIVTMSAETSRKFVLFGHLSSGKSMAIHLDFSAITKRQCKLSVEDPNNDDFELWSPSEEREEACLFGRQTLYHRRLRDRDCVVGNQIKNEKKHVKNCECRMSDFECEFNHIRDEDGHCVLAPGASALTTDTSETCIMDPDSDAWYERTAYRKIPYSTCEGGERPDRGVEHSCGGVRGHGFFFWMSVLILPFGFTALVAWWYYKKGHKRGCALHSPHLGGDFGDGGVLDTLASVPWFLLGVGATAWSAVVNMPIWDSLRSQRGYRNVPIDEDARVLRFEDDD